MTQGRHNKIEETVNRLLMTATDFLTNCIFLCSKHVLQTDLETTHPRNTKHCPSDRFLRWIFYDHLNTTSSTIKACAASDSEDHRVCVLSRDIVKETPCAVASSR